MSYVEFNVLGDPKPQGSMRAFTNPKTGRPILTSASKGLPAWRRDIKEEAVNHFDALIDGPVGVWAEFRFTRPKSAKKGATWKISTPDLDKLVRSLLDALTGVAYQDDARVARLIVRKRLTEGDEQPGVLVRVEGLEHGKR